VSAPIRVQAKTVEETNFVETAEYQKKDDLGKLDELIGGF